MSRGAWWIVLIATLALGPGPSARAAVPPQACAASNELTVPDESLQHVATAIAAGGPLNVLALGSASTTGEASSLAHGIGHGSAPGQSFPYKLAEALQAALPNIPVRLTVRGGRGMTAEAMVPLLREALKTQRYQLVLWQTGTVEAVRGLPPDDLLAALEEGVDLVEQSGANLVLIDMQFSRFLRANADLDPYEAVLQQVATLPDVVVFHRFDLMHDWMREGRIDLERTSHAERAKTVALLNTCLGDALARFVLKGAAEK